MIDSEHKFLQALDKCIALADMKAKASSLPYEAIDLFCEISQKPSVIINLIFHHSAKVQIALNSVRDYAANADNWKINAYPFGVKDHCSILGFFLQLNRQPNEFEFFSGNFQTPEDVSHLLIEWKGINLLASQSA